MPSSTPSRINKHDIQFLLDSPSRSTSHQHSIARHQSSTQQIHQQRRSLIQQMSVLSQSSFPNTEYRPQSPVSPQSTPSVYSSQTSRSTYSPTSSSSPSSSRNICKECSQSFPSQQELTTHIRTAHRLKPFACKLCDKTFAERGNANKHYRVAHLKQRNHRCTTCDRSFAFRDGLNRHISMVHLNERPFECTECMCPAGPHSPDIACTHICGMRFKQKSHRRRHVLSVHQAARRREEEQQAAYSTQLPHLRLPPQRSQHVS